MDVDHRPGPTTVPACQCGALFRTEGHDSTVLHYKIRAKIQIRALSCVQNIKMRAFRISTRMRVVTEAVIYTYALDHLNHKDLVHYVSNIATYWYPPLDWLNDRARSPLLSGVGAYRRVT